MFFNGLFNFGEQQEPQRRPNQPNRQQPNYQNRPNNNGAFGGIVDFLQENFMNPLFQPNNNQREQNQNQRGQNPRQQNNQEQRPTFVRAGTKKEGQKQEKKKDVTKKVEHNENTGIYWKERANEELKQGRLETALRFYDKAIELNNTESIFFSNRARCLKKMGTFDLALRDAQEAIELDNDNIKGHLLCGQILAEIGKQTKDLKKVSVSVTRLTKALTLCVGQHKDSEFQDEIGTFIYRAKKLLWYLKFEEIKERRIKAISEYKQYLENDEKLDKETALSKLNDFIEATNESIIFQIPEYLTCRITLDLMEDPVVTDSGQVYERTAIQEHIERNGKTDPFTRKPISGILYPCISVKKAIEDFLERNPWAYEFSEGETYKDINF